MRRTPKIVLLVALALTAIALPTQTPVVSAVTGEPIAGVGLEHSAAYLLLAPLFGVMDYLTVLSVPQHVTVLLTAIVLFGLWRALRERRARPIWLRGLVELGAFVLFLASVLGFYAVGALAPRPMARLTVDDPDVVVVDFHSHTSASHDGRASFSAERNRAWHRGAGFHVAYVADHDSIGPVLRAARRNPARAGDGTVLLPGREVVYAGQHVSILGTIDPRLWDETTTGDPLVDARTRQCAGWPVLVQTIPNDISRVPPPGCADRGGGVDAIELVDGAPRGLAQADLEGDRIVHIADSLDIALVAASNLHGWGSTAVGWSLLRIPGWRELSPAEVGRRIEQTIRRERRQAVEVVTYHRVANSTQAAGAAAAAVMLPIHFVAIRSRAERVSWIAWLALAALLPAWARKRKQRAG